MNKIVLYILFLFCIACSSDYIIEPSVLDCTPLINSINPAPSEYQNLIDQMKEEGLPGVLMNVRSGGKTWTGASGYSDLKSKIPIQPCNITRVGSTVKTLTAVSILLLQEGKLLDLDDPISKYLSTNQLRNLENADKSSIRNLLQHSSGIFNYIVNLNFQTASLNDLEKVWQPEELMSYARGQKAIFQPGTNVSYSNTNYILLGWIIESITGKPFYEFFENRIFAPLGMDLTQFAAPEPIPTNLIRGYVDFYSNFNVINSTYYSGWDYFTADGGLISNPYDLTVLLTGIFEGDLLSQSSLDEMMTWESPDGKPIDDYEVEYGLGIFRMKTPFGYAYNHSGDAIGYFATMFYFPDKKVAISWAANGNYGKLDDISQSKEAFQKIFETVLANY